MRDYNSFFRQSRWIQKAEFRERTAGAHPGDGLRRRLEERDAERILSTLTPDCRIVESHGPTYQGRAHVRQWITGWFEEGGRIQRWDVTSFMYAGDRAAFEWTFECSGSWGGAAFDGVSVVRFSGNQIAYLWSPGGS